MKEQTGFAAIQRANAEKCKIPYHRIVAELDGNSLLVDTSDTELHVHVRYVHMHQFGGMWTDS